MDEKWGGNVKKNCKTTNGKKLKILMIYYFICIITYFVSIYYGLVESVGCF
jgi:hypothetical protein